MSLVLDGSITLAWCFEDETSPAIDELMMRAGRHGAIVPSIWRLEVANGLRTGVRRGRLTNQLRDEFLADLDAMDIATDPDTDRFAWTTTVHLADRYGLTPYDASYLELAQRLNLPLASLDKDLRKAGESAALTVLGT